MLKPNGEVEFLEIDPIPRVGCVGYKHEAPKHNSWPKTDWTDNIADRFKDPLNQELAITVPGWTQRVEERLKAKLRPRDGVAAPSLKSWLEEQSAFDLASLVELSLTTR